MTNQDEFLNGPDQILPSDQHYAWSPSDPVMLRTTPEAAQDPISVPTLLKRAANRYPDRLALSVKRDGVQKEWTYQQYYDDVQTCAKAFINLGLERFSSVLILGFNSPEWMIADLAAIYAGGIAVGVYITNGADACLHNALDSNAKIAVVENYQQLQKILAIKDQIPDLKAIVQWSGEPKVDGVLSWQKMMELGQETSDEVYQDRLKRIAINQCCTMIYTSGTTAKAKGVMLNHDNLTWSSERCLEVLRVDPLGKNQRFISYLPVSHVAAQITDIYAALQCCATAHFGGSDLLKDDNLIKLLRKVRPTFMLGVPRVWEKISEKMKEIGNQPGLSNKMKRPLVNWSKKIGNASANRQMEGKSKPYGYFLANQLVFKKVRQGLGLDRCANIMCGAAPLSKNVWEYFASLNIFIFQTYGMSESTGPHSVNSMDEFRAEGSGISLPGCEIKIANHDCAEGEAGELMIRGRHVFMGYINNENATKSAFDQDGYLYTGDIGKVDDEGHIFITGRAKEIIITAGGENVAPVPIEDRIKQELPFISQAVIIGDKRKFLTTMFFILKVKFIYFTTRGFHSF